MSPREKTGLRERVPKPIRRTIFRLLRWPPIGLVRLGSLRRTTPISRTWGFDRGQPIDRHYIEGFLSSNAELIRGRVLEVADNSYTMQFGGDRVTRSDILHINEDLPKATIIGDLANGDGIPPDAFDCVICTQTLQFVYDVQGAVKTLHRILAPGGAALVTVPGISQISRADMDQWGDFWRFTTASVSRLFGQVFDSGSLDVRTNGNVLSSIAFLHGLSTRELGEDELSIVDPDYQMLISICAKKH